MESAEPIQRSRPCPICGGAIFYHPTDHPANSYYVCRGCHASWSDGKEPDDDF
jgi:hypothetical protein